MALFGYQAPTRVGGGQTTSTRRPATLPVVTKPSGTRVIGGDILAPASTPAATVNMVATRPEIVPPSSMPVAPPQMAPAPTVAAPLPVVGGVGSVGSIGGGASTIGPGGGVPEAPIGVDDPTLIGAQDPDAIIDSGAVTGPSELELAEQAAYDATLDAIAAKYGMTREQLLMDEGDAGREYRMAMAGLQRNFARAMDQTMGNLTERGILRSGETERQTERLRGELSDASGEQVKSRDARLARIAAKQATLPSEQAAEEARAKANYEAVKRDLALVKSQ